jgi:hypothetical protein
MFRKALLTPTAPICSASMKGTIADYVPCVTLPVAPSNELFMDGVWPFGCPSRLVPPGERDDTDVKELSA